MCSFSAAGDIKPDLSDDLKVSQQYVMNIGHGLNFISCDYPLLDIVTVLFVTIYSVRFDVVD